MVSVPTWQACRTAGRQCVLAVLAESYLEILGTFVISFVFFVWLLKPESPDPPRRSRARRRRTQPVEHETRRVQRPRDATKTPACDERRAPPVVERGAAAGHAPTSRVDGTDSTAVERPVKRVEGPSVAQRLQRPHLHSETGRPAEGSGLTRRVSPSGLTRRVSPSGLTRRVSPQSPPQTHLHSETGRPAEGSGLTRRVSPSGLTRRVSPSGLTRRRVSPSGQTRRVSPRSQTGEAQWQSGTRFYSEVVARQQQSHFSQFQ